MSDQWQKDILRLAVEKSLLSDGDWAGLISRSVREKRKPLELAVEDGFLTQEQIEELDTGLGQDVDSTKNTFVLTRGKGSRFVVKDETSDFSQSISRIRELPPDHGFPSGWDRYTYVDFLGEGGMGRVFLAEDPRLKRKVAIKFVRGIDHDAEERFLTEAQSQAQVSHENLCDIFEVGEVDGRSYIVMEYLDGKALNKACSEMTVDKRVAIMKEVAEGVHEAHRSGLIHRDIKPSNIMLVGLESRKPKPVVMDFGLARMQTAAGYTETGSVVGTPHYMPPEQARGEVHKLDRRTDVYAIGATFYEILTGKPPFTGTSSVNVLFQVINDEPIPCRQIDSGLPTDLETIVCKCMEKDPNKRYDSARALADDIGRYLDGEPITARPAGILYRLQKKAAKHKVAVTIGAVAVLAVLISIGYGLYARWEVEERARLTTLFVREAEAVEATYRNNKLIPIRDLSPEIEKLKRKMENIETQVAESGRLARGPGAYALGRAMLAIGDFHGALDNLQAAWDSGFREPRCAYALGQALGRVYQAEKEKAELREISMEEIEKNYRDPARKYLRLADGDATLSPEYLEAQLAYYDNNYDQALIKARNAYQRLPWLYEAYRLEGDILRDQALSYSRVNFERAMFVYEDARKAYERAILIGESDVDAHFGVALTMRNMLSLVLTRDGENKDFLLERGVKASTDMLRINPRDPMAHVYLSDFYRLYSTSVEEEKEKYQTLAIEHAQRAFDIDSSEVDIIEQMGIVYLSKGVTERSENRDPTIYLEKAINYFQKGVTIEPSYRMYNRLGIANLNYFFWLSSIKGDVVPFLNKAEDAFQSALSYGSNWGVLNNLGTVYSRRALLNGAAGEDWGDDISKGVNAYRQAIELMPNKINYANLGIHLTSRVYYEATFGYEFRKTFVDAKLAFEKSIELGDKRRAHYRAALLYSYAPIFDLAFGLDPSDSVNAYLKRLEASKSFLQEHLYWSRFAHAYLIRADYLQQNRRDNLAELRLAHDALIKSEKVGTPGRVWYQNYLYFCLIQMNHDVEQTKLYKEKALKVVKQNKRMTQIPFVGIKLAEIYYASWLSSQNIDDLNMALKTARETYERDRGEPLHGEVLLKIYLTFVDLNIDRDYHHQQALALYEELPGIKTKAKGLMEIGDRLALLK